MNTGVLVLLSALAWPPQQGAATLTGTLFAPDVRMTGAIVYLIPATGHQRGPPPPPPDTAIVDQRRLRFVPRIVVGPPGLVVQFKNGDPVLHNVFSPPGPGPGFNLGTYDRTETRTRGFSEPGLHTILCHIHPEMVAYLMIVPTSLHAVADDQGRFQIEAIPPGSYLLHVWHPTLRTRTHPLTIRAGEHRTLELSLTRTDRS